MIIDFRLRPPHPHFRKLRLLSPDRQRHYAERWGVEPAPSALQGSMALLEAEMREAGITMGIMNASYTRGDPGPTTNDEVAEIGRAHAGTFVGLGSLSLEWSAERIRAEARRCVLDLGLRGMSVDSYLWSPPVYVDCEALRPLYETCVDLDVPVVMTLSGSSAPDLTYCYPGAVDAVAASYPALKIVVAHACWPHVQEMCGVVYRRRNVWISPDMYMLGPGALDYVQAANTFARERFLFATCYPNLPLKPVVDLYHTLPFRRDLLDNVLANNAAALLKL